MKAVLFFTTNAGMKNEREKPFWELLFFFTLGLMIATWLLPLLYWNSLPDIIPTHFNGHGDVDGTGSKYFLFLIPFIGTGSYSLLVYLAKRPDLWHKYHISPFRSNRSTRGTALLLEVVGFLCATMFFFLQYMFIDAARIGRTPGYFWIFWIFIALFLVGLPLLMGFMTAAKRPNE